MSKFLWILGATTLGVAAYIVMNQPLSQPAPADGIDRAADDMSAWGAKQNVFGTGGQLKGKVEQFAGNVTGDPDLGDKGVLDEATGAVKDAAGKAARAVGSTVRDLNS